MSPGWADINLLLCLYRDWSCSLCLRWGDYYPQDKYVLELEGGEYIPSQHYQYQKPTTPLHRLIPSVNTNLMCYVLTDNPSVFVYKKL